MKKLPELLAPAGSFEAAVAAFTYGADAIYLGLNRFSARADASNFTLEELEQILAYARTFETPRKVYVTLNTLTETHERADLLPFLGAIEDLGIDGAIIQDLGVASLLKRAFPKIPRHASTQLACTSTAGARALKDLGFERIVTARELSFNEAEKIGKNAGVEIEVFIHGALCYSLSGLCLYSSLTTGRSGNRGRCAYCCRQAFCDADGKAAHPFSMRDLSSVSTIEKLRNTSIASLKIEGRMKNPLYVAAVTDFYRALLDNVLTPQGILQKAEDLRTIFSRPWTSLYTESHHKQPEEIIDALCIGHRGAAIGEVRKVTRDIEGTRWLAFETHRALEKHDGLQIDPPRGGRPIGFAVDRMREFNTRQAKITVPKDTRIEVALPPEVVDIPAGATIYCSASQAVRRAFPIPHPRSSETRLLLPADLTLTLTPSGFTLSGNGTQVEEKLSLDAAKRPELSQAAAEKLLARLGDDGFYLRSFVFNDADKCFLPSSILNNARRAWAQQTLERALRKKEDERTHLTLLPEVTDVQPPTEEALWTLKVSALQSPRILGETLPQVLVVALTAHSTFEELKPWFDVLPRKQLRWALPVALRDEEIGALAACIGQLSDLGFRSFECGDLTGWQLLQDIQPYCDAFEITADWTWYAINPEAVAVQESLGVLRSVSGPEANLPNLKTLPRAAQREILVAQYTPLFMAMTRPLTAVTELTDRNQLALRIGQLGSLWITFAERPWSTPLKPLQALGFNHFRVDVSWAGTALPIQNWQEIFEETSPFTSHFETTRL